MTALHSIAWLEVVKTESHCVILANGSLVSNPHAWTEKYKLLALDHPLGAGFSYGEPPNSTQTAAVDVYDFLQKIYVSYSHLANLNKGLNGFIRFMVVWGRYWPAASTAAPSSLNESVRPLVDDRCSSIRMWHSQIIYAV